MSQDALGQLKHLKTARARWPFPDESTPLQVLNVQTAFVVPEASIHASEGELGRKRQVASGCLDNLLLVLY